MNTEHVKSELFDESLTVHDNGKIYGVSENKLRSTVSWRSVSDQSLPLLVGSRCDWLVHEL